MDVVAALLADAANLTDGKLNILGGGLNHVYLAAPDSQLSIVLVLGLRLEPVEIQVDQIVSIELHDVDGRAFPGFPGVRIGFRAAPGPMADPGDSGVIPLVVPLTGLVLPVGPYTFVASTEQQPRMATIEFRVSLVQPQIGPGAPQG